MSITENVQKTVLPNGLTTLIKETTTAPVAAILAHVKVGYFNEPDHLCGISHVIEHMLFKGTKRFSGRDQIAQEVRALGGNTNAGTYYEDTYYYITLPSSGAPRAIELLADMIQSPRIDADELAAEIEVIIQESKQKRDNPSAVLMETLYSRAFDKHRIRRWRIGEDTVLRGMAPDVLHGFMKDAYVPSNTILTVVGDIRVDEVLGTIQDSWTNSKSVPTNVDSSEPEPLRTEFRYHRITGDIKQRLFGIVIPAPAFGEGGSAELMVLENVLSDGRSSRLFRAIKEDRGLAGSVWAGYEPFRTLGLFTLGAEVNEEDPAEAERAVFNELYRLVEGGVKDEELVRVKTRMRSRLVSSQEEVLGVARSLAWYEAAGSYMLADTLPEQLYNVTPADVRSSVENCLLNAPVTLLEYLPAATAAPARTPEQMHMLVTHREPVFPPMTLDHEKCVVFEDVLDHGESLLFRQRQDLPLVSLHILFPGGRRSETAENAGITHLMLRTMLKGTASRTAKEISDQIESLGSGIGISHAADYFGFSIKLLADRFMEGVDILRDILHNPAFLAAEVDKEKTSTIAAIRRQHDSMRSRAFELFNKACYCSQPYGFAPNGEAETVSRFEPDDLKTWWQHHVKGQSVIISAAGDIEFDRLRSAVGGMIPVGGEVSIEARESIPLDPGEESVRVDRHQTAAVMGFPGVPVSHPDRFALDVLAELASGQSGRFFKAVRSDNSLAYAVSSSHRTRKDAGSFLTYAATSPENEERAREVILAECRRLAEEPVSAAELSAVKESINGEYLLGMQSFSAQAGEMAMYRLYGQPLDYALHYLQQISELTAEDIRSAASRYLCSGIKWLGVVRGKVNG